MDAVLAAGPLLVALVALLVLRRSATVAGAAACALALGLIAVHPAFGLSAEQLGLAVLRGLLVTLLVAYILFFGLLLYHLMARGRAMERLADALARLPGDRAAIALVLCLPLGAFFESASGFGVGIVIVGPLLLALGFVPGRAALLALLTQNAVPWGALSVGTIVGAELSGFPPVLLGVGSAYLSAAVFPYFAALALILAGGPSALRANAGFGAVVGAALAVAAWAGTALLGVELAMLVGGVLVAVPALAWLRRGGGPTARAGRAAPEDAADRPSLARACAPYAVLLVGLLASRLVAPLRDWLLGHAVLSVPAVSFSLPLLYTPGFWLAVSCAATAPLLGLSRAAVGEELARTARRWLWTSLALAVFLVLSELMLRSGMTRLLAEATALALGPAYVLAAPAVGGLGSFLTGSNAAGNAMFMGFQLQMAEQFGVPPLVFAAAQNAASALSLASPQRVVLATAVLGLGGREGGLIRSALLIGAGAVGLVTAAELVWLALLASG